MIEIRKTAALGQDGVFDPGVLEALLDLLNKGAQSVNHRQARWPKSSCKSNRHESRRKSVETKKMGERSNLGDQSIQAQFGKK